MTNDLLGYFVKIVVQFWCRRVFILLLGEVYLGLSGLFSNILTLLSLAELGVGSAISFSLYKPLAENDQERVKSLMRLFKRAYFAIGIVVAALGVSLTPFLQFFIKDMPDIPHIRLIYVLYVVNSAVSYLFIYKRTLIVADQKEYIASRYSYGCAVVMNVVQLAVLYITRNFLLYLGTMIVFTVLENLLISVKADKCYPYLRDKDVQKLPEEDLHSIKKNIGALIFHQVGRVLVNGTDNLLISKMVDLVSVGLYSNYLMVKSALNTVLGSFYKAIFASIGNVNATEPDEVKKLVFDRINFLTHWMYSFSAICLFCLFNPFISLWVGEKYTFSLPVVFVICLDFFIYGYRTPAMITKNAMGLYWSDRYKALIEALINLVVSILLALKFGVAGIIWGTVISSLSTNFWVEPYVLYRQGLHAPLREYFKSYAVSCLLTAISGGLTWLACSLLPAAGIPAFAGKLLACLVIPNGLYFVIFRRNPHFLYFMNLAGEMLAKAGKHDKTGGAK